MRNVTARGCSGHHQLQVPLSRPRLFRSAVTSKSEAFEGNASRAGLQLR